MKTFGLIAVIFGAAIFLYALFANISIRNSDSIDDRLKAEGYMNTAAFGLIFFTMGILSRQGLWKFEK